MGWKVGVGVGEGGLGVELIDPVGFLKCELRVAMRGLLLAHRPAVYFVEIPSSCTVYCTIVRLRRVTMPRSNDVGTNGSRFFRAKGYQGVIYA